MGSVILVVDDEAPVLRLMERILKKQGFCVYVAQTLEAAVKIAQELGAELDVLIFDMFLGYRSGIEVLKAVHAICPDALAILISGDFLPEAEESPFPVDGILTYVLPKPFSAEQLHETITRALADRDDSTKLPKH